MVLHAIVRLIMAIYRYLYNGSEFDVLLRVPRAIACSS